MPHDRFFVDQSLEQHAEVELDESETRHLRVMRARVGETLEVVNGCNQLSEAELISVEKRRALVKIVSLRDEAPPLPLILCQALVRPNKLDFIVEKGTELGMTEIWLFPGKKSEKGSLSPNQQGRLRHLAIAAMKQCGRLDLPHIILKPPLIDWDSLPYNAYFGDTHSDAPLLSTVADGQKGAMIFIGPESGFSQCEEEKLRALEAIGVRLHVNILRTETAAILATCVLSMSR